MNGNDSMFYWLTGVLAAVCLLVFFCCCTAMIALVLAPVR